MRDGDERKSDQLTRVLPYYKMSFGDDVAARGEEIADSTGWINGQQPQARGRVRVPIKASREPGSEVLGVRVTIVKVGALSRCKRISAKIRSRVDRLRGAKPAVNLHHLQLGSSEAASLAADGRTVGEAASITAADRSVRPIRRPFTVMASTNHFCNSTALAGDAAAMS